MARRSAPKTPDPDVAAAEANEIVDGIEIGPDAEFFAPRDDLRGKARPKRATAGEPDPVEAAEAAVARMADRFDDWMAEETSRLVALFAEADETEFDGDALEAFHRAAHDIKGQAATLGFPVAGRIAASLCRLIEAKLETGRIPRELVQQHVLSVRAIIVEQAREDESATALRLADRLDEVTHDYLEQIGHAA